MMTRADYAEMKVVLEVQVEHLQKRIKELEAENQKLRLEVGYVPPARAMLDARIPESQW